MMKKIKLGDWVEAFIYTFSFGYGSRLSTWIAVDVLGYKSCGCCQRKEWLNRLTDKTYNAHCGGINLF